MAPKARMAPKGVPAPEVLPKETLLKSLGSQVLPVVLEEVLQRTKAEL